MSLGNKGLVGKPLSHNTFPKETNLGRKPNMVQRKVRNPKRKRARRIKQLHRHLGQ